MDFAVFKITGIKGFTVSSMRKGSMLEDLPTPQKSITKIKKEQKKIDDNL